MRESFSASTAIFDEIVLEENEHYCQLINLHQSRFGDTIPLIRREHIAEFYARHPVLLIENLGHDRVRDEAHQMERNAQRFYETAAKGTTDASARKLLGDLAAAEAGHAELAGLMDGSVSTLAPIFAVAFATQNT